MFKDILNEYHMLYKHIAYKKGRIIQLISFHIVQLIPSLK